MNKTPSDKSKNLLLVAVVILLAIGVVSATVYSKRTKNNMGMSGMSMQHGQVTYKLSLEKTTDTYQVNQSSRLAFTIRDQNNKVFKDFAVDNTKLMHLIVVRKDRTNFQHVHPTYDNKTGHFTMTDFKFPTDGDYRVFANFTPKGAMKDNMGMIESQAPFQDVRVGDVAKYSPQAIGPDVLASTINGFTAHFNLILSDDSPGGTQDFTADQDSTLDVSIEKDGQPYTNLQPYLGALGHLVILGPNLEFIHAHPIASDIAKQTGMIGFMVNFPVAGQYKLYLQTQAANQVSTFDFNLTVKAKANSDNGMSGMDMQNMSH